MGKGAAGVTSQRHVVRPHDTDQRGPTDRRRVGPIIGLVLRCGPGNRQVLFPDCQILGHKRDVVVGARRERTLVDRIGPHGLANHPRHCPREGIAGFQAPVGHLLDQSRIRVSIGFGQCIGRYGDGFGGDISGQTRGLG